MVGMRKAGGKDWNLSDPGKRGNKPEKPGSCLRGDVEMCKYRIEAGSP